MDIYAKKKPSWRPMAPSFSYFFYILTDSLERAKLDINQLQFNYTGELAVS